MEGISASAYMQAARTYRAAGWRSVLPLPAGRKSPPPAGYTGWAGVVPSGADIEAWLMGPEAAGNIALHLRDDVIGIDVDAYAGKGGAAALAELTERAGAPLPDTWVSSARADGVSGIRLYRAAMPAGRVWADQPAGVGRGIEMIHRGHRYAVVWPSLHPAGRTYRWIFLQGPEWQVGAGVPRPADLPELPVAWAEVLSRPGEVTAGSAAGHAETLAVVEGWPAADAEPCGAVRTALDGALAALGRASVEALHPTANGDIWEMVRLGHEGHRGARLALARHYSAFLVARGDVRHEGRVVADAEWWRMVRGAVGKLPTGPPGDVDPCAAVLFAPGPEAGAAVLGPDPFGPPPGAPDPAVDGDGTDGGGATAEQPVTLADLIRSHLLDRHKLRTMPRPKYLIRDVLDLNSETWLIGASGSMKSFVAIDWACHVATGLPWRNHPTRQGRVLYIVAEGASGFMKRIEAWEKTYGREALELVTLPRPVQAANAAAWSALCEVARELQPALVVLDTQARMTVGLEENSNTAMGQWVDAIGGLRAATGACVLPVHHTGRDGRNARGASALDGAQDAEWKVVREDPKALDIRLQVDKNKDGADTLALDLSAEVVQLGADEDGREITSLAFTPWDVFRTPRIRRPEYEDRFADAQQAVMEVLRQHGGPDGLTIPQIIQLINERHLYRDRTNSVKPIPKTTARSAIVGSERLEGLLTRRAPDGDPIVVKTGSDRFASYAMIVAYSRREDDHGTAARSVLERLAQGD